MLGEAFEFTRDALVEKWMKWLILIVGTIIFPILFGYILRIFRGERSSPDTDDLGGLFIDGLKLFVVLLIWAIPAIIVGLIFFGGSFMLLISGSTSAAMAGIGAALLGVPILIIVEIVVALFETIGVVRFARTESFGEAFNFSAILTHIGRIGWGPYIIALIVVDVILGVIVSVLNLIPILGQIILLIIAPAIAIFAARYVTLIYDSAPAPA